MSAREPSDDRTQETRSHHGSGRPGETGRSGDTGRSNRSGSSGPHHFPDPHGGCPTHIGRYEVRGVLGDGAFGRVYHALDPVLRREVAIKVPHGDLTPAIRERFLREARAAATIHHPNVCPIYDVGTDGDLPFLVMHFVRGRTLADMLAARAHHLPVRHAAAIARKIALGVAAAHTREIVHRDLKPQNVLWDEANRQVLVTDFGLARVGGETPLTGQGDVLGTPSYMAPEQARGNPDAISPLSDVYALGVVLYRLLAGETPYQGSVYEIMIRACEGNPRPPSALRPGLDRRVEAVCLKAMAVDPVARYPSARAFADALGDFLQGGSDEVLDLPLADPIPDSTARPRAGSKTAAKTSPPPRPRPVAEPVRPGPPRPVRAQPGRSLVGCAVVGFICCVVAAAGVVGGAYLLRERARTGTDPVPPKAVTPPVPDDPGVAAMKQVTAALVRYHDTHGEYPPARLISKTTGSPVLSWRVALLPELGEQALYDEFNRDEPWDGPTNKALVEKMPRVFQGSLAANEGKTAFKVFFGPRAAFDRFKPKQAHHIVDGVAKTIGVVEADDPVEWTRPSDISFDGQSAPTLVPPGGGDALLVGMLDGTVRRISLSRTPPDELRNAIDVSDGNAVTLVE
jgi:serine/threonine protein kinase